MNNFKQTYFLNRNYSAIYAHNFFDAFGKSMLEFFSAVILYQLGMPIHFIILFFALKFGLMGALSPLSLIITSRLGLNTAVFISGVFYCIGAVLLLLGSYENFFLLFSSFIFFALKGAIYHPLINGVISMYVGDEHRGRFNSLNAIFMITAVFLSVSLGSFFLIRGMNAGIIFFIVISLLASLLVYVFLLEKKKIKNRYTFKSIYSYLFSKKFRPNIIPFSMETLLIVERLLIPLFIFIYFDDLKLTTLIIIISIFIEIMILYLFGNRIDKFSKKSFFEASLLKSINPIIFLLSYFNFIFIYIGQFLNGIVEKIFTVSFHSKIQQKGHKIQDPILFMVAKEMSLCFAELIILLALFAVSLAVQEKIFIIIFLGSFASVWIIHKSWKD